MIMVQQFITRVSHDYGAAVISLEYHIIVVRQFIKEYYLIMVQQFIIRVSHDYGAAVISLEYHMIMVQQSYYNSIT